MPICLMPEWIGLDTIDDCAGCEHERVDPVDGARWCALPDGGHCPDSETQENGGE